MNAGSEKVRLASELAALEKHLGSLEAEICAADLRLAEIESEQREILRRRALAEVWSRIAIVDIETAKEKLDGQKQ